MATDPLSEFDREIIAFLEEAGVPRERIQLETPQQRDHGERAVNAALKMARERRQAPLQIAEEIAGRFQPGRYRFIQAVEAVKPGFLNFRLDYASFIPFTIEAVRSSAGTFGRRDRDLTEHVVVEHTSVNPNKEWHIGHVRNAVLGDVVARLLRRVGEQVEVQNYIDDTGLQAAQAVFGLQAFPEQTRAGEKYDHFVGRAYVKVAAELAAAKQLQERRQARAATPTEQLTDADRAEIFSLDARLDNLKHLQTNVMTAMHELEAGRHHDVIESILNAQLLTAYRLGIFYDLLNWESHLLQSHLFGEAIAVLQRSPQVYRPTEGHYAGALVIETSAAVAEGDEPKREVLIRSNNIATYVGKDITYSIWKFHLLPDRLRYVEYAVQPNQRVLLSTSLDGDERDGSAPDRVINVIAVDQTQAQDAVKDGLRAGGFPGFADRLVHLDYGLVTTAEGRISGRKGTAAAGDTVIDEAVRVALERVREKRSQDLSDAAMSAIAEAVGIGAVRYFMTQYNPQRPIVFDVGDVVSYDGNTGLYIQYALVRMFAILRRAATEHGINDDAIDRADTSLLGHEQERRLSFHIGMFPELLATAARTLAVNLVAEYAFELATIFNQFYRDCGVLNAEPQLRCARLLLVRTVRDALSSACDVLGVPVIERL